jgi:hypothetical protein
MINHIVILKFKSHVTESDIDSVVHQLGNLKELIPSIKSFSFGKNISLEQLNKGYTHAFIMTFDDVTGRDLYVEHPEHKKIATELLMPMLEEGLQSVVVLDFENE